MIVMDMHLHSNYSDGKNSLEEMILASIEVGYTHIAFTDHVWKTSEWVDNYINDINKLKIKYEKYINIYSGVEAKVVDDLGNIDLDDKYIGQLDYICAAFHRIPLGDGQFIRRSEILSDVNFAVNSWYKAFINVLKNPRVDFIAHPTSVFSSSKVSLCDEILESIVCTSIQQKKRLEINIKRQVPEKNFLKIITQKQGSLIIGSDSHSVRDIKVYKSMIENWNRKITNSNKESLYE